MRNPLAIASIGLLILQGTVNAEPLRACAEVSSRVDVALRPALANLPEGQPDAAQLGAQLQACLSSRNICSVVQDARHGTEQLIAGDMTADLPAQYMAAQGKSSVVFLVRSIPRVGNDSNQYCLVSERSSGATSVQQWDVYGWVLAPNGKETLPLQRQVLNDEAGSDPKSLRGLAAALWFFAARMSGQPPK